MVTNGSRKCIHKIISLQISSIQIIQSYPAVAGMVTIGPVPFDPYIRDIEQKHDGCEYAFRAYVRISNPKPTAVVLDRDRRIRWHAATAKYVDSRRLSRVHLYFD